MNPLAKMWAENRLKQLEKKELSILAQDVRRLNAEARPMFERLAKARAERMRQAGQHGFVMVREKIR